MRTRMHVPVLTSQTFSVSSWLPLTYTSRWMSVQHGKRVSRSRRVQSFQSRGLTSMLP